MRLPTSYKPALTHRSNPVPPRPRSLLPSTTTRPPPSSDETAAVADHPTKSMPPSIEQPKPRAAISSLLHGASPAGVGRPTFPPRSTDDQFVHRREQPPPPPSPTRSAVSQPPAASTTAAAAAAALGDGDSEARVSLWTELKDIRRRTRTPGAVAKEPSSPP